MKTTNPAKMTGFVSSLCAAIKAALGGDEQHYPIFEAWNLLEPSNTPQMVRQKWESLHPPFKVGADYVYRKAAEAGWQGYGELVFGPVQPAGGTPVAGDDVWDEGFQQDDPEWLAEWVWVEEQRRFLHVASGDSLEEDQFARRFATPTGPVGHRNNPARLYFVSGRRRLARRFTYLPGAPRLPIIDGCRVANLWRPAPAVVAAQGRTVTDQDVRPWLDHWEYLVPDPKARRLMLDWMAYVVQRPQEKPNWALFLGGGQGIGKGLAFLPLVAGVGQHNTSMVRPDDLAEKFNDWLADKRLVMVEEMKNFDTRTVMNKLKVYITTPPEMVPVRRMNMPKYDIPNVACFLFMSNFRDALNLEEDDRRFFVCWSNAQRQPDSYYVNLAAWMDGPGRNDVVAWLLARDVRAFAPIARGAAPHTADKDEMRRNSGPDAVRLLLEMIDMAQAPFDTAILNPADAFTALGGSLGGVKLSPRHVEEAMRKAGGGMLPDPSGKGALVIRARRRDSRTGTVRETTVRVWACRDLDHWSAQQRAVIRREYEKGMGTADDGAALAAVTV